MGNLIRIPKRFFDDCTNCETGTPVVDRETKSHYFVDMWADETASADFVSRAWLYEDSQHFSGGEVGGICASARATLRALAAHGITTGTFAHIDF